MNVSPIQEEWIYIYLCKCGNMVEKRAEDSLVSFGRAQHVSYSNGESHIRYPMLYKGKRFHSFCFEERVGYLFNFTIKKVDRLAMEFEWCKLKSDEMNPAEKAHSCAMKKFEL